MLIADEGDDLGLSRNRRSSDKIFVSSSQPVTMQRRAGHRRPLRLDFDFAKWRCLKGGNQEIAGCRPIQLRLRQAPKLLSRHHHDIVLPLDDDMLRPLAANAPHKVEKRAPHRSDANDQRTDRDRGRNPRRPYHQSNRSGCAINSVGSAPTSRPTKRRNRRNVAARAVAHGGAALYIGRPRGRCARWFREPSRAGVAAGPAVTGWGGPVLCTKPVRLSGPSGCRRVGSAGNRNRDSGAWPTQYPRA